MGNLPNSSWTGQSPLHLQTIFWIFFLKRKSGFKNWTMSIFKRRQIIQQLYELDNVIISISQVRNQFQGVWEFAICGQYSFSNERLYISLNHWCWPWAFWLAVARECEQKCQHASDEPRPKEGLAYVHFCHLHKKNTLLLACWRPRDSWEQCDDPPGDWCWAYSNLV